MFLNIHVLSYFLSRSSENKQVSPSISNTYKILLLKYFGKNAVPSEICLEGECCVYCRLFQFALSDFLSITIVVKISSKECTKDFFTVSVGPRDYYMK